MRSRKWREEIFALTHCNLTVRWLVQFFARLSNISCRLCGRSSSTNRNLLQLKSHSLMLTEHTITRVHEKLSNHHFAIRVLHFKRTGFASASLTLKASAMDIRSLQQAQYFDKRKSKVSFSVSPKFIISQHTSHAIYISKKKRVPW